MAFRMVAVVVMFVAGIARVAGQQSVECKGPLTEPHLLRLLAAGVTESRLRVVADTCGVAIDLTHDVEVRLRAVGASDTTMALLRSIVERRRAGDVAARRAAEETVWKLISASDDPRVLENFLKEFPDGTYAGTARDRLEALRAPPAPVADRFGLTWVAIPSGTFEMGCVPGDRECDTDESPRHRVTISRGFALTATEVTVAQYRASGRTPAAQPSWSGDRHPVVHVTWDDARAYCAAAGGRLPTEAEWEYAARRGREAAVYPWGNEPPVCTTGATNGARFRPCGQGAAPVATFRPNGYGLYDMPGNVSEWLADWHSETYYRVSPTSDPPGPTRGVSRVVRGGSWNTSPRGLRVSNRSWGVLTYRFNFVGFRCAR